MPAQDECAGVDGGRHPSSQKIVVKSPPPTTTTPSQQQEDQLDMLFQRWPSSASLSESSMSASSSDLPGLNVVVPRRAGGKAANIKKELYKTEPCRSFQETGTCRYGKKCQFAHSNEELRQVKRHPKYKTKPCRNFCVYGSCPYGVRCRFIHSQNQGAFQGLDTRHLMMRPGCEGEMWQSARLPIFQDFQNVSEHTKAPIEWLGGTDVFETSDLDSSLGRSDTWTNVRVNADRVRAEEARMCAGQAEELELGAQFNRLRVGVCKVRVPGKIDTPVL
ncbi:Zinc finger protein zfs1 [Porphyridium purpureum]|uniref:Zinc finger protein zfs1 n=1 Tax=Porphyridium purpureum TaxID=35688 RepID=A0A5J4Z5R5_PORPP|nr:Zinc finger protein zfs1 [Porphyridium purpureum]|eukprot:POR0078..scf295_1